MPATTLCSTCNGSGNINGEDCPTCFGNGQVPANTECTTCLGVGYVGDTICTTCFGNRSMPISGLAAELFKKLSAVETKVDDVKTVADAILTQVS